MEEDRAQSSFKLGGDDQDNDSVMQSELQELKIEKLSQRVLLLTILIPCMIGIIVVISYLDIKDRVSRTQSSGTIGVQKLSKELESKFSSLSLEQAKLKEIQSKKIPALEKDTAFLQTRLKKVQTSISALEVIEAAKIERDELDRVVASLNTKIAAIPDQLRGELEAFRTADRDLKTQAQTLEKQLGEMAGAFSQLSEKLAGLQSDLSSVSATKIDKNELDLALKLKEIAFRQEILAATASMEKKLEALHKEILSLKKAQTKPAAAQQQPVQQQPAQQQPVQPETKTSETTATEPQAAPKPEGTTTIEEQTIE